MALPPAAATPSPPTASDLEAQLVALVARVMHIQSVAWGGPDDQVRARFVGRIVGDTARAFDRLWTATAAWNLTPLFRAGPHGEHVVLLVQGRIQPQPSRAWVNLALFLATLLSVLWTGFWAHNAGHDWRAALGQSLAFAASLLAILLAHEFGHYFMARRRGMAVSLPYFLPLPAPLSPFGTLGAFIRLKEPPRNRRVLLDVGLAGPIAGLMVALPLLFLGLKLSDLDALPTPQPGMALMIEGNSLLYLAAKYAVFGRFLPAPVQGWDWATAVRFFFTGRPVPWGGVDVLLHPVAFSAWVGLLVTALNLLPVGQLDGGHVLFALLGYRARRLFPWLVGLIAVLGVFWKGWWLWTVLILWLGRSYAEPLDMLTPLDPARRRWAWLGLLLWLLTFTPIPLQLLMVR